MIGEWPGLHHKGVVRLLLLLVVVVVVGEIERL